MGLIEILLIVAIVLLLVNIFLSNRKSGFPEEVKRELTANSDNIKREVEALDRNIRDEFPRNREESAKALQANRAEINAQIAQNRRELGEALESFKKSFSENVQNLNDQQRRNYSELAQRQEEIRKETTTALEKVRNAVENRLEVLQKNNEAKLEQMRQTVDEKLQSTLEKRLSESFKQVSERLQQVHEGLGEMKNLATGVGDLKKVLSNVKTRGILGEIQLGNILESIMSPEQYDSNVVIKPNSREHVEFAIKLPGKDDSGDVVYLPIDAKFPLEAYYKLIDAIEVGNVDEIQKAQRAIENSIKANARDIRDKYISPPHSTDFGILFLPIEGLYAEVVRNASLVETLQRDYKIIVTGPTTLAALLNSLQMGFRTLAIQKRSSEVWKVLGAVKTQFEKFGDVLKKAQDKINKASADIDVLVGTRTRMIQSKLKQVEALPEQETVNMLGEQSVVEGEEGEEGDI